MYINKTLDQVLAKVTVKFENYVGKCWSQPHFGVILTKFLAHKDLKIGSIETKLIHSIDMMHIKLLTKFEQKFLLSLKVIGENAARNPIVG